MVRMRFLNIFGENKAYMGIIYIENVICKSSFLHGNPGFTILYTSTWSFHMIDDQTFPGYFRKLDTLVRGQKEKQILLFYNGKKKTFILWCIWFTAQRSHRRPYVWCGLRKLYTRQAVRVFDCWRSTTSKRSNTQRVSTIQYILLHNNIIKIYVY